MTRRRFTGMTILWVLFAFGGASAARAQGGAAPSEAGFQPNRDYLALLPFESIDSASNNVILTFTDLVLPGNGGRELRFERVFSNQVVHDPSGPQWRFGIAGVPMRVVERPLPKGPIEPPGDFTSERLTTPYFWMLDGSRLETTYVEPPGPFGTWQKVQTPNFWRYNRQARTLRIPDGTVAEYCPAATENCPDGYLKTVADPLGNAVTLTWAAGVLQVVQSLGNDQSREIVIQMDEATGLPTSLTYDGRTWTYHYGTPGQLSEVEPPLGPSWKYEYSMETFSAGKVTRVTTPQGGEVEYVYEDREFLISGSPPSVDVFNVLTTRRVRDQGQLVGEWTFEHSALSDLTFDRTEVTLPSNTKVIYVYGSYSPQANVLAGSWLLRFRYVQAPDGSTLETEEREYQLLPAAREEEAWGVPRLVERTITRAGQTHTIEYSYTDAGNSYEYHHPTTITERGPGGTVRRTTSLTYDHFCDDPQMCENPQFLGLPKSESTTITGMTTLKSWTYETATGFRQTETLYGITTSFTPDAFGNVATATKENGKVTAFTYDWGVVKNTSTPGVVVTRAINPDGTVESESVAGRTTTYEEYDALFRITRTQPPGGTNPIITDYDNTSGRSATTRRGTSFVTTTTDGFARPITTENSVGVRTSITYDAEGRKTYQSYPFLGDFGGPTDIGTSFSYDPLGRVTQELNPDASSRTREYDDANNAVTVRDEENRASVFTYRGFGHPDDARLISVVDANQQEWTYTYDAIGNLAQVVAPMGETRTWLRNTSGLVTSETHPESGTVLYTQYDPAGVLKNKTDANGTPFGYQHDGNDRVTRMTAGTRETHITYEPGSDNRLWMSNGSVSTTFVHDGAGRLAQRKDVVGAYVFDTFYTYDNNDQLTTITYPSARVISYQRDTEGRIIRVFETAAGRDYAFGITYHPSGALATSTAGNNIATTITYDPNRYWVQSLTAGALQLTYTDYDGVGNVQTLGDSRQGMGQRFTYDALHRLWTASGPYGSTGYAYDAHGNRQSAYGSTYVYDSNTLRLTAQNGVPFGYDNNGNLTSKPSATNAYTPENWLATATVNGGQTTYAYDADGWRAKKTAVGDTTFYLRGLTGELLTEWHNLGTSARARDYVYAGSHLLSAIDRTTGFPSICGGESIPDGSPQSVTVPSGSTGSVAFEGSACRRVSVLVTVTSGSFGGCNWLATLRKPDGTSLGTGYSCGAGVFIEPATLPVPGTYSVLLDPSGTATGTANVSVYDIVDVTTPIVPNGVPVVAPLTTPGLRALLPFSGTQGQKVSLTVDVTSGSFGSCNWPMEIRRVSDNSLVQSVVTCGAAGFLGPTALPATADYVVVVNPSYASTGTAIITLYTVVDVTTPITINGPAGSAPLTTPGQTARLPFTGTQGQTISLLVKITSGNFGSCNWPMEIRRVSDNYLVRSVITCGLTGFLGPTALPTTGDYLAIIDPSGRATGTSSVTLYGFEHVTTPITINGSAVTVPLTKPGQTARLPFAGTQGQTISLLVKITSGSFGSCNWPMEIRRVSDNSLVQKVITCGATGFLGPTTLPTTGDYLVILDPSGSATGTANVNLYGVIHVTTPITINGPAVTAPLTTPGQTARLPFNGTANQRVRVNVTVTSGSFGSCNWPMEIRRVSDNYLVQKVITCGATGSLGPTTLPTTGDYLVIIDPSGSATGTANVTLTNVS